MAAMLTLEERRWVLAMLHACPDLSYLTDEHKRMELANAAAQHIAHLVAKAQGQQEPDIPANPLADWVRHIVLTCPREIVGGALDPELVGYALQVIDSPLIFATRNVEAFQHVLGFLNTKSLVSLASSHPMFRRVVPYDPFAGARGKIMLGNLKLSIPIGDLRTALTWLAQHAFNEIHDRIPNPGVDRPRSMDNTLSTWSAGNKFGESGKSFRSTNCVARSSVGGDFVYSVNFIRYGLAEKRRLVKTLRLRESDYYPITHMHAEMRIAQKQDDEERRAPIFVDKMCCPFCAVQLLVLGRLRSMRGSTTTDLQWYTFSPYVMYFRHRRERLWGAGVEAVFNLLSPDAKLMFLEILARSCRTNKYAGLPALQDVAAALAGR
jgi:hypothetical protein